MTTVKSKFLKTVIDRGFFHQCTDIDALDARLHEHEEDGTPLAAYIGFDCTAKSLHVGSLMQIMMLYWLQQTGHKPIVLMGGGTTKIGDPSGKDEARKLLTDDDIAANMAGIKRTFDPFLKFGEGKSDAVMVNNDDWLKTINYIEFLRDYGRHFSVNRMMSMDSVKLRLEREHHLSFLEFNYMILQAYDFVELNKRLNCRLQIGGSDQWGNIVNGVDLHSKLEVISRIEKTGNVQEEDDSLLLESILKSLDNVLIRNDKLKTLETQIKEIQNSLQDNEQKLAELKKVGMSIAEAISKHKPDEQYLTNLVKQVLEVIKHKPVYKKKLLDAFEDNISSKIFGLTTPLLATSSGAKMGKTASGAVWLDREMLSPYDYWQYWRNTEDGDVGRFLKLFTTLHIDEIKELESATGAAINEVKKRLATEVTKLCHGEEEALKAADTARKTFEQGGVGDDLPEIQVAKTELDAGIPAFKLFQMAGLAASGGEARKLIKGKGAKVNDAVVENENVAITSANLTAESYIKLSAGKKRHTLVKIL